MYIHVVSRGDTLDSIAGRYGVSASRIAIDNALPATQPLVVGQALLILLPEVVHQVAAGDTVYRIAEMYQTSRMQLWQNNPQLIGRDVLYVGETVVVSFVNEKDREITVNGYAYPYISREILLHALPYLTRLTIFGYGFLPDGELIPIADEPLLALARQYGVQPILLLSSMGEDGTFDGQRASRMFADVALQERVLGNILQTMRQKGYAGLDIDFEYIEAKDAANYLDFVTRATRLLGAEGYSVNVDLAPKHSAEQRGLLYEAHDYATLGNAADTALIMTYEWGYAYGPPMAVAPIQPVERVVAYAISEMSPQRIFLGIPNYGYNWELPFEQGNSRGISLGNEEAIRLAAQVGAEIQFDTVSNAPWFSYWDAGQEHVVWFEDVRSIQGKMDLIKQQGLLGAGYWNIMRPFQQNWSLLNQLFFISKTT